MEAGGGVAERCPIKGSAESHPTAVRPSRASGCCTAARAGGGGVMDMFQVRNSLTTGWSRPWTPGPRRFRDGVSQLLKVGSTPRWGRYEGKKESVYLKRASHFWLSIQSFIFPQRKLFLGWRSGGSKERPFPPPPLQPPVGKQMTGQGPCAILPPSPTLSRMRPNGRVRWCRPAASALRPQPPLVHTRWCPRGPCGRCATCSVWRRPGLFTV